MIPPKSSGSGGFSADILGNLKSFWMLLAKIGADRCEESGAF